MNIHLLKVFISACTLAMVLFTVPGEALINRLASIDMGVALRAFFFVFVGTFYSSYRFMALAGRLHMNMNFRTAHFINIMSHLSGIIFFNVLGQMIARTSISSAYLQNAPRMVLLTLFEKAISFISLLMLATIGAYVAVRAIHMNAMSGSYFLLLFAIVSLTFGAVWRLSFNSGQKRYVKRIAWALHKVRLEHTFALSVLIHLLSLCAYVFVGHFMMPGVSLMVLTSAFSVVMLAASVPISFAGWGVRELTAGFVFSTLSLDPAVGVAVSAVVGAMTIIALGGHALTANFMFSPSKPKMGTEDVGHGKVHVERAIAFFGGIFVAVLVGIQMRIPHGDFLTTVNLADPVSIVAGLSFLALWYTGYRGHPMWRVPNFNLGILLFALMILMGWGIGYLSYGGNVWASINRVFGLIIILSYLASGALFVAFFGHVRALLLLKAVVILALITYFVFLMAFKTGLVPVALLNMLDWYPHQFNGLILNKNAFAFQMLLVFACLLALPPNKVIQSRQLYIAVILLLIIASGSRAAVLSGIVALGTAFYLGTFDWWRLKRAAMFLGVLFVVQWLFVNVDIGWAGGGFDLERSKKLTNIINMASILSANPYQDRIEGYVGGLNMWLNNFFFGGGLGAFIETHRESALVIHNSILWVLAEMGTVGLVMYLFLPFKLVAHALRNGTKPASWSDAGLILCLASVLVFSMFHEITYQRFLWFVIGLLAAERWQIRPVGPRSNVT